jgi:hypothetical protein
MTAAVMGMPSHYGGHGGIGGGPNNNSNSSPDFLERFFSGWENAFCAPRSAESLAKEVSGERDVLDYVFDHVESYTCSGSSIEEEYPPPYEQREQNSFDGRSLEFTRDNSLLEQEQNGAPTYLEPLDARNNSLLSNIGHEGDMLDLWFERVESFVCSEGREVYDENKGGSLKSSKGSPKANRAPMRNTTNQHRFSEPESSHPIPSEISTQRRIKRKKKKRRPKQNVYPDEEDNILLYYRPVKQAYV